MSVGLTRPRIRSDLRFIKQESEGNTAWLVKDPVAMKYFRFGALESWIMQQLDGRSTLDDVCRALHEEVGLRTTAENLDGLVRRLREVGLVERSAEERSALLMEQLRHQRRARLKAGHGTLWRMQFTFGNPDRFFSRIIDRIAFFWTPGFIAFSVVLFAIYAVLLAQHWPQFLAAMGQIYHPASLTPGFAIAAWVSIAGLLLVHELGHGLTCKRFGGEVQDMGMMLLYFTPAFYCNVNDAWTFEKRSERLWVTFAGGWIELVTATLAVLVWLATEPGTLVNAVALFIGAFGGGLALLLNYNPLIQLDGYYALVDWLQIPNLRGRAMEYTGALLKRRLLGMDVKLPVVTDRERRVFLWYGVLSPIYVVVLLSTLGLLFANWMVRSFGGWGFFMAALALFALTARPRHALGRLLRVWRAEKRPLQALRRRPRIAAALLLLPVLVALVPWTVRATTQRELEPAERIYLRAPGDARIAEVRALDGSRVAPGDTLLLLHDPDLRVSQAETAARVRSLEREATAARARGDVTAAALADVALRSARAQASQLEKRQAGFALVAGTAGVVVAPRIHEHVGARLAAGDSAAQLWRDGPLLGRLRLPQRDAGNLATGSRIRVRFPATGGLTLHGSVLHVEPLAAEGVVQARVTLDSLPPELRVGMTGRARVDLVHTSIGGAVGRGLRRTLRLDLLL